MNGTRNGIIIALLCCRLSLSIFAPWLSLLYNLPLFFVSYPIGFSLIMTRQ